MKSTSRYIKSIAAAVLFGAVLYGLFLAGTYNPYNELSMLSLNRAAATTDSTLDVPELETPDPLEVPELETPGELDVPELETPELDVPELDVPELDVPELDVPELDVPELDVPELDVPELDVPELDVPELDVPELDVPVHTDSGECELSVHKEVDNTHAEVGDTLTYTIQVANVGDADCSGDGVKIFDEVDSHLTYDWHTYTSNFDEGYGAKAVYTSSDRTLRFNGNTLTPGESGSISWTGVINEPSQCGDFTVTNTAKATAKELNNYTHWEYSSEVETTVDYSCPDDIERPECPYQPTANRTIVDFGNARIFSDRGDDKAMTDIIDTNLSAGTYTVTLASWDGYEGREFVTQPMEQWFGVLFTGATEVTTTNESSDVPDTVRQAFIQDEVNQSLVLNQTIDGVQARHFFIGGGKTPNSVGPICAVFDKEEVPTPSCDAFSATPNKVDQGDSVTLAWETTNTTKVEIDNGVGDVAEDGSLSVTPAQNTTYTLTAYGTNGQSVECDASVEVEKPEEPNAPTCPLVVKDGRTIVDFTDLKLRTDKGESESRTAAQAFAVAAGSYDITLVSWDGYTNRASVSQPKEQWQLQFLTSGSVVGSSNSIGDLADNVIEATKIEQVNTAFELTTGADAIRAFHPFYPDTSSPNSLYPICAAIDEIPETPVASCDSFGATPGTITQGDDVALNWETTNATRVVIDNGVGEVAGDGTTTVAPLASTTYTMTVFGADNQVTCEAPVVVEIPEDTVPQCVSFTGSPLTVPYNGGTTTLAWETSNADTVTLTGFGAVAKTDNADVFIDTPTTFTLNLADTDGDQNSCEVTIDLEPEPQPLTCASDVDFTISDSSVDEGESVTLDWDASDRVESVSIDQGIGAVSNSGSRSQSVDNDTTYTLTATAGDETISCPVSVDVDTGGGGGGGGSSSPRCELEISDSRIDEGDEVTITWETSRATEVTLIDDRDNVIFTTDDFLNEEKDDWFDGSITVEPTRDTEYTLIAERGSRDRECEVRVRLNDDDGGGDDVVVIEERIDPLVAGISLSQVPYTGFEAGPILTVLFYLILMTWAFYMAYILVVKYELIGGTTNTPQRATGIDAQADNYPNLFVQAVVPPQPTQTPITASAVSAPTAPSNLPTTEVPMIGYAPETTEPTDTAVSETADIDAVTVLENKAHEHSALVSSEALSHLLSVAKEDKQVEALECVIATAKVKYPTEDGWMVLNQSRMDTLCQECLGDDLVKNSVQAPIGSGSLAEAILSGNITGAYGLIGNRPMVAVADAASDLDAVYRARKGAAAVTSDMLQTAATQLSDQQIHDAMIALTSALDGTYNSEEEAVKMAIMKAVKATS